VTVVVGTAAVSGLTLTVAGGTALPVPSAVGTHVVTTQVTIPQAGPSAQAVRLLRDGTLVGNELTFTPTCATGTAWDGATRTCFKLLCYGEKLTVIRDSIVNATNDVRNGVPFSITRVKRPDGTTERWEHAEVRNMTGIPDNWSETGFRQRYFNCAIGPVDRFGRAMRACRVQDDIASGVQFQDWWELFYINHETNTFHRIPGRLPGFPDGYRLSNSGGTNLIWEAEQGRVFFGTEDGVNPTPFRLLFQPNMPGSAAEVVMTTFMGPTGGNTMTTPVIEKNTCTN
jgi:hypothetical protein